MVRVWTSTPSRIFSFALEKLMHPSMVMVATRPWNPWNPWKTQNVLECPWKSWNLPKCPWIVLEFHLAVFSKNVVSKFHFTFKFHNFLQPWRRTVMEYTLVTNGVILDCFRWSNFKIFFSHGEGMEYTLVINGVILDCFRWLNFKSFFNHMVKEWNILVINWVVSDG